MLPIEKRAEMPDTRGFVVAETVDVLAAKFVALIGDRRITKMHRYIRSEGSSPSVYAGLRPDHRGYEDAVGHRKGQGAYVHLASRARGLEGAGFSIGRDATETEESMRKRYHDGAQADRRTDITYVELTGWPGSPARNDSIRIEYWNEYGVGQETILVFDDFDLIDELFWDVKGDRERQVCMWDSFCDNHELHYEHPAHRQNGQCVMRDATRAENLAVLAYLAARAETPADADAGEVD
jgi:hypothetical protein